MTDPKATSSEECDVLVVGAGAAGLAAARRLADINPELKVIVLEGRERVGGRTCTMIGTQFGLSHDTMRKEIKSLRGQPDISIPAASAAHDGDNPSDTTLEKYEYLGGGHAVEIGAEFIHGEPGRTAASTWELLDRYKMSANSGGNDCLARETVWVARGDRLQQLTKKDEQCNKLRIALIRSIWKLESCAVQWFAENSRSDPDQTSCEHLIPSASKGGFTKEDEILLRNAAAEYYGADLEDVSLASIIGEDIKTSKYDDKLEYKECILNDMDDEEKCQFRIDLGYSELWRRVVADGPIDVRLHCQVTRISKSGLSINVDTALGSSIVAKTVIVTVPLALLQSESISFHPQLSMSKQSAIERLGSGHASKVILTFSKIFWPKDFTFIFTAQRPQVVWRPGEGIADHHGEKPKILTCFFGGNTCKKMGELSEDEAVSCIIKDLAHVFKKESEEILSWLVDAKFINWSKDPWSMMAYSYDPLGSAGARSDLASSEWDGALLFAGEATSISEYASVHGAIDTGYRAAEEAVEKISKSQ